MALVPMWSAAQALGRIMPPNTEGVGFACRTTHRSSFLAALCLPFLYPSAAMHQHDHSHDHDHGHCDHEHCQHQHAHGPKHIYVYSPSGAVRDKKAFKRAVKRLEAMGHQVEVDQDALASAPGLPVMTTCD